MNRGILLLIGAAALLAFTPAEAQTASKLCPPGTSMGACWDNAFAKIEELERRVEALETQRGPAAPAAMSRQPADEHVSKAEAEPPPPPDKHGCTGGKRWIGDECSCPIIAPFWNGKACVGLDKAFD